MDKPTAKLVNVYALMAADMMTEGIGPIGAVQNLVYLEGLDRELWQPLIIAELNRLIDEGLI